MKKGETKSDTRVDIEWILKMTREMRIAFLQGLADGDGFASTRFWNAGIGSKHNADFIRKLLESLGVESSPCDGGIEIRKVDALRQAAKLPMFRYAIGRLERLKQITDMIAGQERSSISEYEKNHILNLHENGLSYGEISEHLWEECKIARRPTTLRAFVNRLQKNNVHNIQ